MRQAVCCVDGRMTPRSLPPASIVAVLGLSALRPVVAPPPGVHGGEGARPPPARAAAAIGRILLDHVTPDVAIAEMKRAGTDPRYRGLYAAPVEFKPPDAKALASVTDADLPSTSPIPPFAQAMVEADHKWDRMRAA